MAAYKDLVGQKITKVTSNPSEPKTGQMWYNSTDGKLRGLGIVKAWASGSNLANARDSLGGFGTQTVGLMYGGSPNSTEEYNGTGFSTGGALNTARATCQDNGWGVQTAGVVASGSIPGNTANVEEYDGSSFTEVNNVSTARRQQASIGLVQTAGAICGGYSTANTDATEEYDGTNWTTGGTLNTARRGFTGAGSLTSGIVYSGYSTAESTAAEEYDGTSWTTAPSTNTARNNTAGSNNSPQNTALLFGGHTGTARTGATEEYDGTSWTEIADMATARNSLAGAGTGSAALASGGSTGSDTSATEEFTSSTNTITAAAFSSGGNMPEATSSVADGGTATAAVEGAGQKNNPDSTPTSSAEYNGTSWTAGNSVPAPYGSTTGGTGTQTALITGGKGSGNSTTFEYDGTNWTAGGSLGTGRYQGKNLGTQTAAAYCGGRVSPPTLNNVEEYDGSSWTSVTAMPIAIRNGGGYGIQTAGVIVSGFQGPSSSPVSPASSVSRAALGFNYDGTNWTTGTSSLIAGASGGAAGIQTVGFFLAGENPALSPSSILTSQTYDGTSYTTNANTTRSRATNFGITSSRTSAVGTAAAIFGGTDPAATPNDTAATEEYNVETIAANITDFTTS
jgi:hypothetical protein